MNPLTHYNRIIYYDTQYQNKTHHCKRADRQTDGRKYDQSPEDSDRDAGSNPDCNFESEKQCENDQHQHQPRIGILRNSGDPRLCAD